MRILYIHQYFKFPHESGGTRSFDLATQFVKNGYKIDIITSTSNIIYSGNKRWVKLEEDGLIVHYIYLPYGNHLSYFQRSFVFFKFLLFSTFKALSLKSEIVIATSTPLTIGIPALIKKWIQKTPFIFEVRDVWPEAVIAIGALKNKGLQKVLYGLEAMIYKNADAIVPLSVDMKFSIISRYPQLIKKPLVVVENISEINRFQNGFDSSVSIIENKIGFKPRFSILYAGTFGRVNGIQYVVELAHQLREIDDTIVFILIGNGAEKNDVINLGRNKSVLNKTVFVLDSIPKQDLPQLYYECSMGSSFVIDVKELWANSANKFFDTLAASKPILINHEGWQKDLILERNIGYVLPEIIDDKSVIDFAQYTRKSALLKEQRESALAIAKDRFALNVAIEKYIYVLNKVKNIKKTA